MSSQEIWDLIINTADENLDEQFRASRSTRSGRPGNQADESIFDGLPVRQWRLQESTVGAALSSDNDPSKAATNGANGLAKNKMENRMPNGSHLYTPWCQQLLRAARMPRLPKRAEPSDGREDDKENEDEQAPAAAAIQQSEASQKGFIAPKWAPVPKHLEEPDRAYLAKRRKGLPSAYAVGGVAASNGQAAFGTTTTAPDGSVVAAEEPRRRMPPPRRKPKKGPGRRKKIIETEGQGVSASADALIARTNGQDGSKGEQADGEDHNGDARHEDDEDEEGEDDEEGEEGEDEEEDEEDDDHEEGEITQPTEENAEATPISRDAGHDTVEGTGSEAKSETIAAPLERAPDKPNSPGLATADPSNLSDPAPPPPPTIPDTAEHTANQDVAMEEPPLPPPPASTLPMPEQTSLETVQDLAEPAGSPKEAEAVEMRPASTENLRPETQQEEPQATSQIRE